MYMIRPALTWFVLTAAFRLTSDNLYWIVANGNVDVWIAVGLIMWLDLLCFVSRGEEIMLERCHMVYVGDTTYTEKTYNIFTNARVENTNGTLLTGNCINHIIAVTLGQSHCFLLSVWPSSGVMCCTSSSSITFLCFISYRCRKYSLMACTVSFSRIMSAAFSAIITWVAYESPLVELGTIEASTMRRPLMPRTLNYTDIHSPYAKWGLPNYYVFKFRTRQLDCNSRQWRSQEAVAAVAPRTGQWQKSCRISSSYYITVTSRDAFCGLEYAYRISPRTPLEELTTLPQTPYSAGGDIPPQTTPHSTQGPRPGLPPTHNFWLRHWLPCCWQQWLGYMEGGEGE